MAGRYKAQRVGDRCWAIYDTGSNVVGVVYSRWAVVDYVSSPQRARGVTASLNAAHESERRSQRFAAQYHSTRFEAAKGAA